MIKRFLHWLWPSLFIKAPNCQGCRHLKQYCCTKGKKISTSEYYKINGVEYQQLKPKKPCFDWEFGSNV